MPGKSRAHERAKRLRTKPLRGYRRRILTLRGERTARSPIPGSRRRHKDRKLSCASASYSPSCRGQPLEFPDLRLATLTLRSSSGNRAMVHSLGLRKGRDYPIGRPRPARMVMAKFLAVTSPSLSRANGIRPFALALRCPRTLHAGRVDLLALEVADLLPRGVSDRLVFAPRSTGHAGVVCVEHRAVPGVLVHQRASNVSATHLRPPYQFGFGRSAIRSAYTCCSPSPMTCGITVK